MNRDAEFEVQWRISFWRSPECVAVLRRRFPVFYVCCAQTPELIPQPQVPCEVQKLNLVPTFCPTRAGHPQLIKPASLDSTFANINMFRRWPIDVSLDKYAKARIWECLCLTSSIRPGLDVQTGSLDLQRLGFQFHLNFYLFLKSLSQVSRNATITSSFSCCKREMIQNCKIWACKVQRPVIRKIIRKWVRIPSVHRAKATVFVCDVKWTGNPGVRLHQRGSIHSARNRWCTRLSWSQRGLRCQEPSSGTWEAVHTMSSLQC